MAGSSFKPNKRGLDQFQKELQRELDKRPVRVRVDGDPRGAGGRPAASQVTYNGPVFQGDVHGAQLAWANSGDVTQRMVTKPISPSYEDLAEAVTGLLRRIDELMLPTEDREDTAAHAGDVLEEVVKDRPDHGRLRRALRALTLLLMPIATGAVAGIAEPVQRWVKTVVENLVLPPQ
jgi:hypothetical protein